MRFGDSVATDRQLCLCSAERLENPRQETFISDVSVKPRGKSECQAEPPLGFGNGRLGL